ncbi:alpha-catulin-like isoform X2 [Tubulanus polymorphus]|uniref:alpha-catulin-like isoform X2 n=1 Tax=Tubulanus polymorphus TaxID=672921 RepID=UPI003DA51C9C
MAAAAAAPRFESRISLEIRTKSVEQTLVPLVTQITTLVNARDRPIKSEKTLKALVRVGQAVNLAISRFVTVGESIAEENVEIRNDMCDACKEARISGENIQKLTDVKLDETGQVKGAEKTAMVRAARQLLSAITKVLLLADKVVVKQLLAAKDKVAVSLGIIETVTGFQDFVKAFSQFGNEMVELAHLTGDRQNDLKSDKQRSQMGVARTVLEKGTMMLLTTCKTSLRHPDCDTAKKSRDGVFSQMRYAMDLIQHIVSDTGPVNTDASPTPTAVNGDSGIGLAHSQPTAYRCMKEFDDLVEMTRVTLVGPTTQSKLAIALENLIEATQDFTDSAYTTHEHRERIVELCEKLRHEQSLVVKIGILLDQSDAVSPSQELETAILKTCELSKLLKKQLQDTAMDQASELFKTSEDHDLLMALKSAGLNGDYEQVCELSVKIEEHSEQLQEVCKLLRHICSLDPLVITAEHVENCIKSLCPQLIYAGKTLARYNSSKIARENLDVFCDSWESQINDLSVLVKDINDVLSGKNDRQIYMSLPRPGKHGTTTKSIRPGHLDSEEQAKIAKLGLEMKLITSEMDAETEKWEEPDNDIVKRAKNMSSMAFSMYLFTRGEGPLRTTQDLFTQAEYFAEEGNKLFKIVKEFGQRVPVGGLKTELITYLDKIPAYCQHLHFTLKSPTFGKTATFNKVDSAIQETKNLMNAVAKVVTTCFICATKYNIDYRGSPTSCTPPRWQSGQVPRSNSCDAEATPPGIDALLRGKTMQAGPSQDPRW